MITLKLDFFWCRGPGHGSCLRAARAYPSKKTAPLKQGCPQVSLWDTPPDLASLPSAHSVETARSEALYNVDDSSSDPGLSQLVLNKSSYTVLHTGF